MTDAPQWLVSGLAVVFLWGLVAPRSQWYAFVGWTRADPRATEPGSGAYAVARVLSLVGLIAMGSVLADGVVSRMQFSERAALTKPEILAEKVWGMPVPLVVDRVFLPSSGVPQDLVARPLSGYQLVMPGDRTPGYLFSIGRLRSSGVAAAPGFLGVQPLPGRTALDIADVVVHVSSDARCIPRRVVAVPAEGAIKIGVFFGEPDPAAASQPPGSEPAGPKPAGSQPAGSQPAAVSDCDPGSSLGNTRSYLIPIDFDSPLGATVLQGLDGTPIPLVPAPRE